MIHEPEPENQTTKGENGTVKQCGQPMRSTVFLTADLIGRPHCGHNLVFLDLPL